MVSLYGESFSSRLGIDLRSGTSDEIFKWFIASVLFGARISEKIAINTYKKFEDHGALTPKRILEVGWDGLVEILDEGGYVRYDFKTATKLLEMVKNLLANYGDLGALHDGSSSPRELELNLMALGKGIGPVTVDIFLRELRKVWSKADPLPQEIEMLAAYNLGFTKVSGAKDSERSKALLDLKRLWAESKIFDKTFVDFEVALVRFGRDFCRKGKCSKCELREYCRRSLGC
ncbi:MAG: hypothetical protein H3Z50_07005 [archaeon]|nr:hypothetical protein [archaeon]